VSRLTTPLLLVASVLLHGCASNMAGLDSSPKYSCKAPSGAQCTSVSGVYANSVHGQLMAPGKNTAKPNAPAPQAASTASIAPAVPVPISASPLRSPPRVQQLWVAPWEDSDGDLNEAAVVHVLIDPGVWLIERVRPHALRSPEVTAPAKAIPLPAPQTPNGAGA
jgi:conjugal transfer pilus assembly protein TraV